MGSADRIIRILIAATIVVLYFTGVIKNQLGLALIIISGIFVLTSLISFCPIYRIFGFSTCPVKR